MKVDKKNLDIFSENCIEHFPKNLHEIIAIEEFSEIIKAITKLIRYPNSLSRIENLKDEIADCKIMLNTITRLYGIKDEEINLIMENKIIRGYKRIKDKKNEVNF